MSRLILEGDVRQNFGEFMPIPYIDRIEVLPSATGDPNHTKLKINFSFFFDLPFNFDQKGANHEQMLKLHQMITHDISTNYHFYILINRPPTMTAELQDYINKMRMDEDTAMDDDFDRLIKSINNVENIAGGGSFDSLQITRILKSINNPYNITDILNYDPNLLSGIASAGGVHIIDQLLEVKLAGHAPSESGISRMMDFNYFRNNSKIFSTDGTNRLIQISSFIETEVPLYLSAGHTAEIPGINLYAFSSLLTQSEIAAMIPHDSDGLPIGQSLGLGRDGQVRPSNVHGGHSSMRANSMFFSDVAVEKVLISDGNTNEAFYRVPDQTQTVFYDIYNKLYTNTPIRSTDMNYRKISADLRNEIKAKFMAVADSYEPLLIDEAKIKDPRRRKDLINSMNMIKKILLTKSENIEFLIELNKARRMFLERSTGTHAGQFYEDIGIQLQRANAIVLRNEQVYKRLVSNSKVIDKRQANTRYFGPTDLKYLPGPELMKDFLLDRTVVTSNQISKKVSYATYDVAEGTRFETYVDGVGADEFNTFDDDDLYRLQLPNGQIWALEDPEYRGLLNDNYFANEEYNVSFGYFFFDYDSAIRHNSYMARILDMSRVIDFFGMPFVQAYYQPMSVELFKSNPTADLKDGSGPMKEIMQFTFPLSSHHAASKIEDAEVFDGTDFRQAPNFTTTDVTAFSEMGEGTFREYGPGGTNEETWGTIIRYGLDANGASYTEMPDKVTLSNGTVINSYVAQRALNMLNDGLRFGQATYGDQFSAGGSQSDPYAYNAAGVKFDMAAPGTGGGGTGGAPVKRKFPSAGTDKSAGSTFDVALGADTRAVARNPDSIFNLERVYGGFIDSKYVNNLYRLMTFEFQNIDQQATLTNYQDYVNDRYRAKIHIKDGTKQAVVAIINNFRVNMQNYFENYVLIARQFCNYNNIDENFNDFFIDGMKRRYQYDPNASPWVYAVSLYIKHIEFLTDRWKGSGSDQLAEAKSILQRISPETGTLEQVEDFYILLQNTYEHFYGASSVIGRFLAEGDGSGRHEGDRGIFEVEVFDQFYENTWESRLRSSFVLEERNNYFSQINAERLRYLEADQAYETAIVLSEMPPLESEVRTDSDLGTGTGGGVGLDDLAAGGLAADGTYGHIVGTYVCPDTDDGCSPCSGKIKRAGMCYCPTGYTENAFGKCELNTYNFADAAPFTIVTNNCSDIEDKIVYEAGRVKKRSPYDEKNGDDCQYVKWRSSGGGADFTAGYYWKKPHGWGDAWDSKYNTSRYGDPSEHALKCRKIDCEGRRKNKKCRCYHYTKPGCPSAGTLSSDAWRIENKSSSEVKSKIRYYLEKDC